MSVPTGPWRLLFVCLCLALALLTALPAQLYPENFFQDDAYFYPQIASNLVAGHGSTFHQITPTNGYHPLWMWLTTACMAIADGNKPLALHVVVALQAVLFACTAWLFARVGRRMQLRYWPCGLAMVTAYLLGAGVYGSEAHINALMLVAGIVWLWTSLGSNSFVRWLVCGTLFGFAILARLDNVFVAFALIGAAILYDPGRGSMWLITRAGGAALGGAIVVVPYVVYNLVWFGHAMPISGAIKSIFPEMLIDFDNLGPLGRLTTPFAALALISALIDRDSKRRVVWLGLGIGVLAHAGYIVAYTDHYTFWAWYYVAGVVTAGLVTSYWTQWVGERMANLMPKSGFDAIAAIAVVLLLAVGAGRAWIKQLGPFSSGALAYLNVNSYRWPDEVGPWLKHNLPPDSTLFVFDYPGSIAYHSDLRILPMDGLVNDFNYNDELLSVGVKAYLCRNSVDYFFGLNEFDEDSVTVDVQAPLYRKPAGVLELAKKDLVVKIRDFVERPDEAFSYTLWRLNCPHST